MAGRKKIEYYGEEFTVPDSVAENIAEGKMTTYTGQCLSCVCFNVTDEQKAADRELSEWCIVKCWRCHDIYKHALIHGLVNDVKEGYKQRIEELEKEIEELKADKGIAADKRNRGKSFPLFEKKWYILYEILYKKAKPQQLGKLSKTSKAKLYRVGYALIYATTDKATFDTVAKTEGISKETAGQVYQYILQNPPSKKLLTKAEKKRSQ